MSTAGPQTPLGDPPLSPAQRSKIRRLAAFKEPDPGEEAGELNIIPYLDIIVNVLVFVLASVAVTFLTQLDTQPPSIGGKGVKENIKSDALNLAIVIVDDGVSFKTSFGQIAPGCNGLGKGITIPNVGNNKFEYDVAEVKRCAREMKNAGGGKFEDETQVTVTASRNIEYRYLVAVLDALRVDDQGELFPEFHLGVTK
ncbi:MAG: biopolymer transporter ExbD [Myxococcales bacterium]|nr:biopolymer transporter ExbD [Myxococcales bacterium]